MYVPTSVDGEWRERERGKRMWTRVTYPKGEYKFAFGACLVVRTVIIAYHNTQYTSQYNCIVCIMYYDRGNYHSTYH